MKVGVIGGGNLGRRLAALWQGAVHDVVVGVRGDERPGPGDAFRLVPVEAAAAHGEAVVLAVPFGALARALPPLAPALAGKVVVDATNPVRDDWSPLPLGEQNSAGEEVARLLPGARVVKAFNTVFADVMTPGRLSREGLRVTAFVAGDDEGANELVAGLAADAGFAPLVVGPLANARHLEAMAHLNIALAVGRRGGTNAAFVYHRAEG
ncbi:MAG TPA: NAD(P)-binding domain-containing protein [Polyangiaceae bacterium]|nr:NAD(P)-binding domain-containing protein [Polyangiaceae bacterium]